MSRATSDKLEEPSTTACAKEAKPRAVPVSSAQAIPTTLDSSDPPSPGPLESPAATAEAAEVDAILDTEAAEVDAVLDEWARGPETPPASQELRQTIKRAHSTSGSKDSPTP